MKTVKIGNCVSLGKIARLCWERERVRVGDKGRIRGLSRDRIEELLAGGKKRSAGYAGIGQFMLRMEGGSWVMKKFLSYARGSAGYVGMNEKFLAYAREIQRLCWDE